MSSDEAAALGGDEHDVDAGHLAEAPGTGPMASRAVKLGVEADGDLHGGLLGVGVVGRVQAGRRAKWLAVAVGGGADAAAEGPVQGLGVLEADGAGHGGDGEVGGLEQAAGRLDPQRLDVGGRASCRSRPRKARAKVRGLMPARRARASTDEVVVEVVGEPALDARRWPASRAGWACELRR